MQRTKGKKHKQSKLAKLSSSYLQTYKAWDKVYNPALSVDIHFTNKGWQHLQQEKRRTGVEKEARLKLLPLAKHILEKANFYQDKRLQDYKGVLHQHYGFTAIVNGVKITVVVIEDKGQIDFLSVFKV